MGVELERGGRQVVQSYDVKGSKFLQSCSRVAAKFVNSFEGGNLKFP